MNKIQKMIMSFAAVAMIVGFSAFKLSEKKLAPGQFRFYNISGAIGNTNPANFVYQDNTSAQCTEDLERECSALWTVDLPGSTTTPSPGDKPNSFASPVYNGSTDLGDSHQ
jgi:hypothetical protein